MPGRIDMVDAEIMKQQGSCFWTKEQTLEARHICLFMKLARKTSLHNRL